MGNVSEILRDKRRQVRSAVPKMNKVRDPNLNDLGSITIQRAVAKIVLLYNHSEQ